MRAFNTTHRGRPPEDRPRRDTGTAELVLRRILAVGTELGDDGRPPDPALAATPLGILEARRLITLDQREAGDTYRRLYATAGQRRREIGLGPCVQQGSEASLADVTKLYQDMTKLLAARGVGVLAQVVDVAVFQSCPRWLGWAVTCGRSEAWRVVRGHRDCADLLAGLDELERAL